MKKQHQRPEFTVINIDHENEKFFVASGIPPFVAKFSVGTSQSSQLDNGNKFELPKHGATGYDSDIINLNW